MCCSEISASFDIIPGFFSVDWTNMDRQSVYYLIQLWRGQYNNHYSIAVLGEQYLY